MNKKIVIGNWKMNPSSSGEAENIFKEIIVGLEGVSATNVVVCPPYPFLEELVALSKKKKIAIGAENCFYGAVGPHTGEVSAEMLASVGVKYVIIGHSERRVMGEDNEMISKKVKSALLAGLKVVLCVGESVRDESGDYLNLIKQQLVIGFDKVRRDLLKNVIIAYEPVWAIGKDARRPAHPQDVLEISIFIKKILTEIYGREEGLRLPIIYGGSVDAGNCRDFLFKGNADGLLVGRESLNPANFIKILKIANEA